MSTKNIGQLLREETLKRTSALKGRLDGGLDNFIMDFAKDDSFIVPSSLTYSTTENSYSGTDCTIAIIYNKEIVILGNVQTATYSIHREKYPVRTLGRTYPKNYVRGTRTIAGSLVFIQFNESPLYSLYQFFNERIENNHRFSSPLADEIPPFDMMLIFENEYGKRSIIRLYGVEITDEGGTFSINDIYSENVMQFIAKDIDPMVSDGNGDQFKKMMFNKMVQGKILDSHYNSMLQYKAKLESNLADVDKKLTEVHVVAGKGLNKPTPYSGSFLGQDFSGQINLSNKAKAQNADRLTSKNSYLLLTRKRQRILKELEKLGGTIANYEKTKMTWNMNSAIEPNKTASGTNIAVTK